MDLRRADLNGCVFENIDFHSGLIIDPTALHNAHFEQVTVQTLSHQRIYDCGLCNMGHMGGLCIRWMSDMGGTAGFFI